jgi:hypothetical protein
MSSSQEALNISPLFEYFILIAFFSKSLAVGEPQYTIDSAHNPQVGPKTILTFVRLQKSYFLPVFTCLKDRLDLQIRAFFGAGKETRSSEIAGPMNLRITYCPQTFIEI